MSLTDSAAGPLKRTEFDTEGIALARKAAAALPPTIADDSDTRAALRAHVARTLYERGAPTGYNANGNLIYGGRSRQRRQAFIVLGPPAAGKSSALAEPIAIAVGAHIVDSDAAKELLPEFRDGLGAGAVHEESAIIARELVLRAIARRGENVVLPLVGRTPAIVADHVQLLQDLGYSVHLYLVELPLETATRRAVDRFHATGRLVDPLYVLGIGTSPHRTYERQVAGGGLASYARLSNDVSRGAEPVILESSAGATTRDELIRSLPH